MLTRGPSHKRKWIFLTRAVPVGGSTAFSFLNHSINTVCVSADLIRESTANMSQTPPMSEMKSRMEKAEKMKDEDKLYKREGILYSTILSPPETLDKLKDLEAREDDLILVAYPKCGE